MVTKTDAEKPLRADAERNRQKLIEAARIVFAAKGLSATLDDVAHEAGTGIGTVYRRFPDKESLVEAAMEASFNEMLEAGQQALVAESAFDGLVGFIRLAVRLHGRDRGLKEATFNSQFAKKKAVLAQSKLVPIINELVVRAKAEGDLRSDFAETDIPMLFCMLGAVADVTGDVRDDLTDRYISFMVDAMRANTENGQLSKPLSAAQMHKVMASWPARKH